MTGRMAGQSTEGGLGDLGVLTSASEVPASHGGPCTQPCRNLPEQPPGQDGGVSSTPDPPASQGPSPRAAGRATPPAPASHQPPDSQQPRPEPKGTHARHTGSGSTAEPASPQAAAGSWPTHQFIFRTVPGGLHGASDGEAGTTRRSRSLLPAPHSGSQPISQR